jgi:hypothetical protein
VAGVDGGLVADDEGREVMDLDMSSLGAACTAFGNTDGITVDRIAAAIRAWEARAPAAKDADRIAEAAAIFDQHGGFPGLPGSMAAVLAYADRTRTAVAALPETAPEGFVRIRIAVQLGLDGQVEYYWKLADDDVLASGCAIITADILIPTIPTVAGHVEAVKP